MIYISISTKTLTTFCFIIDSLVIVFYILEDEVVTYDSQNQEHQCIWSEWESYACDRSCGGGTKHKQRNSVPTKVEFSDLCPGPERKTESCNTHQCPQSKKSTRLNL